ncbi:hypothetical protein COBT_002992, partial [Conglomerata obtusa]
MNTPMDIDFKLNWKREEKKIEQSEFITKKRKYHQIVPYIEKQASINHKIKVTAEKNQATSENKISIHNLPYLMYTYTYSLMNICVLFVMVYIAVTTMLMFHKEINSKIKIRRKMIERIIEKAKYNYVVNKCEPNQRVPALQGLCDKWECEMSRGIDSVEVFKIVSEVVGDVIDTFVGRI